MAKLKTEQRDLKARYEHAKNLSSEKKRDDLLGTTSSLASTSTGQMRNIQRRPSTSNSSLADSPYSALYQPNHPNNQPRQSQFTGREDFALREHSFLQESERSIDQYIAIGRASLENLVEQRGILKGTQKRLRDAANTLGLSRETISWVESRT